ncbi:MAG: serine/threonine-protein kinase RsbW [Thermoleophilaceae bacterium]|nr:serine/threonine-protein kinase RsbW [Thermoleophilaceae bacterium]
MGNQVLERRLDAALAEQRRQTTRFEASLGTTSELSAYSRLRAANLAVSNCDRLLALGREREDAADRFAFSVLLGRDGPRQARAEIARCVHGRVDAKVGETVRLLVSETVTNAVVHGSASADETVRVDGEVSARRLRVEVTNAGRAFDHSATMPDADDPGGRGLFLVDQLSRSWGNRHVSGETSVWFEVPL